MKKSYTARWKKETPEQIIALLYGLERDKESPEFKEYCEAVRVGVHEHLFSRALGPDWERKYRDTMSKPPRKKPSSKSLPPSMRELLPLLSPEGATLMPHIWDAHGKAETQLPRYFRKVRGLLHQHVVDWLEFGRNTEFLMKSRPNLSRAMDKLLKLRHPVPLWNRSGPSELHYPPIEQFTAAGAELEAARLLLVLLKWPEVDYLRQCDEPTCQSLYIASRTDQQYCDKACRQKFNSQNPKFKQGRKEYMRKYRQDRRDDEPSRRQFAKGESSHATTKAR